MTDGKAAEVVRKIYADFSNADIEAIIAAMADDVHWVVHGPADAGYFGTYEGRAGVRRWSEQLRDKIKVDQLDIRQIVVDGDSVVVVGDFAATANATGRSYTTAFAHVWAVRDGAVARFEDFFDTAAAVGAQVAEAQAA